MTEFEATFGEKPRASGELTPFPGAPGSKWYNGTGAPDSAVGIKGDYYLDNSSKDYYEKTDRTTWTLKGNLSAIGTESDPVFTAWLATNPFSSVEEDIADEITRAQNAEDVLQDNIDDEAATRAAADLTLSSAISAEQARAESVESSLQPLSEKNQVNGYAGLDNSGKVPSLLLPSFVDDVIEAADFASLPVTGETGKIYVTIDDNKQFRWSGSTYTEITSSPGSTDAVPEGSINLYFTGARVLATLLSGLSLLTNAAITAGDSVLSAFGKIQAQINAVIVTLSGKEDASNKDTDNTLSANSDTKYASQKAVKSYIDNRVFSVPTTFDFTDNNSAGYNTLIESDTITLAGTGVWSFAVRGASGSPQLSLNGGSWVTECIAKSGDTIKLRMTSAATVTTARTCYLYTNGPTVDWTITTPAFLPTLVSGCKLWLAADLGVTKDISDFVDAWADQSGNSRNFTQTGSNRPQWIDNVLNGKPVLRFDGVNDRMLNTSTYNIQEIFIILNNTGGATFAHLQTPLTKQSIATADDRAFGTCTNGTTDLSEDGMAGATGTYVNGIQTEDFAPLSSFKILNGRRAAGSVSWDSSSIGSDGTNNSRCWVGDYAEIIVYDNILSASDRTLITNYINSKYGI
jgi:hypothetical protein